MVAVILVLALAYAGSIFFKNRITEVLPVSVFAVTLSVYVFALILPLNVAVLICAGVTVILVAGATVMLVRYFRQGSSRQIMKAAFGGTSMPVVAMLAVFTVFCILLGGRRVFFYDDLSYWGLYTKNIFMIDKLPRLFENCSVDYKDYTPVMQILQYIAMFGRRSFSETVMFRTNVCFIYVMLLPILFVSDTRTPVMKNRGVIEKMVKAVSIITYVIFPHILTAQFYYRLGVDLFLALVFGYALYYIFIDEGPVPFRMTALICSLSFLSLIKTSGIVLSILALILFAIHEHFCPDDGARKVIRLIRTALLALFSVGSYLSWQLFLKYTWNNGYLSNRVKAGITGGTFSFPEYTGEVVLNYVNHFFTYPLTRNRIGVTAFILVLFIVLTHILIIRSGKERPGSPVRKGHTAMFVSCMAGLVIFCIAHLSMYLFVFDEWEAHGLLEFDRYITQYLGGVFFLYVCLLVRYTAEGSNRALRSFLCISSAVFIVLLPYADMWQYLLSGNYSSFYENAYAGMEKEAADEWERTGIAQMGLAHDGTARLTVVADVWDDRTQFLEYAAVPQPIYRFVNVPAVEPGDIAGFIEENAEEYVYVALNVEGSYTGDWDETKEITGDSAPLRPGSLYRVEKTPEGRVLFEMER